MRRGRRKFLGIKEEGVYKRRVAWKNFRNTKIHNKSQIQLTEEEGVVAQE